MLGLSGIHFAVIGGLLFGALSLGAYGGYRFEALEVASLEAKYAEDKLEAMQAARLEQEDLDRKATEATRADLVKQASIIATTKSQLAQVQRNVKGIARSCVTLGAWRLYTAAVLGTSPDRVPNDPGGDANRPAGIDPDTFANSIADNFGKCRQVIERQRSLIGLLRQYQAERAAAK